MTSSAEDRAFPADAAYTLTISRNTIDKLGVKLYDKASAVVAELVANAYDADATDVTVRIPLGTELGRRLEDGNIEEHGYVLEVSDDGHGMTPTEAQRDYLQVGRDRRAHETQGAKSRKFNRPVMGRKGIGKLAPFGICRVIEVISAGGEETDRGYLTSHFIMDAAEIMTDSDQPVPLGIGELDRTYRKDSGTTIRLSGFLNRRVPPDETFMRQLERRFAVADKTNFAVVVQDTRPQPEPDPYVVGPFDVPVDDRTRIDASERPVVLDNGEELEVTGWLGLAKQSYRNEEMAGVRIYARGKIVATTRDFELPAGFTGEFTTRSYLVGAVHAEWLDLDEGDDLIRTDRQSILWDSDHGRALRQWGAEIIKEIGERSRQPRRERSRKKFMDIAKIEQRASDRFDDALIVSEAVTLGERIGAFAAPDELEDQEYIEGLSEIILMVAPHTALMGAFRDFHEAAVGSDRALPELVELFGRTRTAELATYGQLASERVRSIDELERLVTGGADGERDLQDILTRAPWLIKSDWAVISHNQSLATFKSAFEAHYRKEHGRDVTLAITMTSKRPDFVVANVGGELHIVEIKVPNHDFDSDDFDRLYNYVAAFRGFFEKHKHLSREFPHGWVVDLIADGSRLEGKDHDLFNALVKDGEVSGPTSWIDFLTKAKRAHEQFLNARDKAEEQAGSQSTPAVAAGRGDGENPHRLDDSAPGAIDQPAGAQ